MGRLGRLLHPSDFSRASGAAFARAVSVAKDDRAELLLVHVLAPAVSMTGDGYVSSEVYQDIATSGEGPPKSNWIPCSPSHARSACAGGRC